MSNFEAVRLLNEIHQIVNVAGGITPRGEYDPAITYAIGDMVAYNGSSYVLYTTAPAGTLPTDGDYWGIVASKGDTGTGLVAGGTAHQALTKINGTDYNTQWETIDKTFVGLGNADNTSDANKPVSTATQTALDGKVDENVAITGATKTKITYDAKGLVTAGADATTADIADSTNKRYVTDANLTVIGNTSGTNSGDETQSTIKTKLGAATSSVDGYATSTQITKLDGIAAGAEVNVNADWDAVSGDAQILNKPTIPTQYTDEMAQDAVGNSVGTGLDYDDATGAISVDKTELSLSKGDVGLGNVDNTSDADKPVSTAQATADGLRVLKAGDTMAGNLNMGTNSLIGGTGVTDILKLQATTDNGTLTSPAIQLLTGNNGATTALTVLNDGKVGVGTTSPSNTLEVNKAVGTISATQLTVANSYAAGYGAGISFTAKQTDDGLLYEQAKITADGEQSWGTTATRSSGLRFFTVNAGTLSEKLRISAAGNVGIGTTSPAEKFVVSDTTSISLRVQSGLQNNIRFMRTAAAAAGASAIGYSSGGASGLFNGLVFSSYDGSVWRNNMYIADTGNVGIGTTSPGAKLDVTGDTRLTSGNIYLSNNYGIISKTAAGTNKDVFYVDTGNNVIFGANAGGWNSIQFKNGATPQMLIDSTGKIGINTTTPGAKLQVDTGAAATVGQIIKGASAQTADLLQIQDSAANKLMVVSSGGNVGIGTTNPSQKLTINGDGVKLRLEAATDNAYSFEVQQNYGSNDTLNFYANSINIFKWIYNTGALSLNPSGGYVGIGTTTPSSTLDLHGSFELNIVNKTADYTAASETIINCTANTFTVTLPTAVGIDGRYYTIKNSGTGVITVATTSSQTIDGAATKSLPTQYDKVTVVSDGANWIIIG